MCGFAVMVALSGGRADLDAINKMTDSIRHRGPDDQGVHIVGPVGFGFRRLSILDLSPAGHQPMLSDDRQKVMVFNGEIYNYLELRKELEALGHRFKSSGDTEVLLHAYCEWGSACLDKLNGMWAFVIFDMKKQVLFGARDRFGIKPLYCYHHAKDCVFFASEIKAILSSGYYSMATNWAVASKFLLQGRLDEEKETFYEGIEQIPPGVAFELSLLDKGMNAWHFWTLEDLEGTDVSNPPDSFYGVFEDAVKLRMRSDVPVGVCLSGGLDSTSIISTMAKLRKDQGLFQERALKAFSYISEEYDESVYILDTEKQTQAELYRLETDPGKLWTELARVLKYHDEPLQSATGLIGFKLMELAASKGLKVLLNGQGADETLGGYHGYFKNYWHNLLWSGQIAKTLSEINSFCARHGGKPGDLFLKVLRRFYRSELNRIPFYRKVSNLRKQKALKKSPLFSFDFINSFRLSDRGYMSAALETALKHSIECHPLPLYLRIEDRNSMAHSIEARLPFLDYKLVSLAWRLPFYWKMRGPWNKYILRESMRGKIPESVRSRIDKMGFPTSVRQWFSNQWYEPMQDLLGSQETRQRGIYQVDLIRKELDRHRKGEVDASRELFRIAQFEVLCKLWESYPV